MQSDKQINFNYAHNDTSVPERSSRTAALNTLSVSDEVAYLRAQAQRLEVPVANGETLNFLLTLALAKNAGSVLEVGCAWGITSLALLQSLPQARLTAIERDEVFFNRAKDNLKDYSARCELLFGDAAEVLCSLPEEEYDFIFLDCAKVQYVKLLPDLKRVLKKGGILLADDVLLYGWVNGEAPVPKKRKMLVQHIREYISAVTDDAQLSTSIIDVGDGLALSVKKQ